MQKCIRVEKNEITPLQNFEVLPQNVPHEGRGVTEKPVPSEFDDLVTGHGKAGNFDPFETELLDRPVQPVDDVPSRSNAFGSEMD